MATNESTLRNLAEADQLRSTVPGELAADFEIVYQLMVDTNAALAENDYNLFAIPDGMLEHVSSDSAIEASSNISEYCGAGR